MTDAQEREAVDLAKRVSPWAWGVPPHPGTAVGGFPACATPPIDPWTMPYCRAEMRRSLARARRHVALAHGVEL